MATLTGCRMDHAAKPPARVAAGLDGGADGGADGDALLSIAMWRRP
jgi:hypothetical protein